VLTKKHGLSIGLKRIDTEFFLSIRAMGTLTHADYEVITPLIDAALAEVKQPRVNVLIDATEFDGWELRAAWDDFKIGVKHNNDFHKIAIYGNKRWQDVWVKIASWFISGEIEFFEQFEDAVKWIKE
jgi:hypothetical protein